MQDWIQDIDAQYGDEIRNHEMGRKKVAEACDISRWRARKAINAIREYTEVDDPEPYDYNEDRQEYTFYLTCRGGDPLTLSKARVQSMFRSYS